VLLPFVGDHRKATSESTSLVIGPHLEYVKTWLLFHGKENGKFLPNWFLLGIYFGTRGDLPKENLLL